MSAVSRKRKLRSFTQFMTGIKESCRTAGSHKQPEETQLLVVSRLFPFIQILIAGLQISSSDVGLGGDCVLSINIHLICAMG